jgi:hypothetical protein
VSENLPGSAPKFHEASYVADSLFADQSELANEADRLRGAAKAGRRLQPSELAIVQASPAAAEVTFDDLAEGIEGAHIEAEQHRDFAIAAGTKALRAAIRCGEMLMHARELCEERGPGEYLAWIAIQVESREFFPSQATCYRYIKAVRYKQALGDESPDFATLKDLYVAAGILPPPDENHPGGNAKKDGKTHLFSLRFDLAAPDPEDWESLDRREFLQKAKPVADLYARCIAIEASA